MGWRLFRRIFLKCVGTAIPYTTQAVAFSRFGKLHEAESSFRRFQDFHVQFFEIRVFFSIFSFHCELKSIYLDRERTDKLCDKFVSLLSRCPNFPLNDVIYIWQSVNAWGLRSNFTRAFDNDLRNVQWFKHLLFLEISEYWSYLRKLKNHFMI